MLQCHVATWRLPSDESSEQGLASQRLLAATAHMLGRVTEASIAEWQTEDEGDACHAYLADLGRQDTAMGAATGQREHASAPEPMEEPADIVSAFWTLSRALKAQRINVEKVARDAVADMAPAT